MAVLTKCCPHCGEVKALEDFGRNRSTKDGRQSWCRICHISAKRAARHADPEHYRALGRAHRKTDAAKRRHEEWKRRSREKLLAHKAVRRAIDSGRLTRPEECSACGATDREIHGHHEDYSEPLSVKWLCPRCHSAAHGRVLVIS
jgi:ribosomal protein S27AE